MDALNCLVSDIIRAISFSVAIFVNGHMVNAISKLRSVVNRIFTDSEAEDVG